MKQVYRYLIIIAACLYAGRAAAQKKNYQFSTGPDMCLTPGQHIIIELQYNDVRPLIAGPVKWYINGEPATVQDPANGILKESKVNPTAGYTAPAHAPNKNPVVISCVFNIKDDITNFSKFKTSPQQITVVCRAFIADNYKIDIRLEAQGHNEKGGALHCLITGKGTLSYQASPKPDGCCPNWKDGQVKFTVNDLTFANSNAGNVTYKSPATFTSDFSPALNLCDDHPMLMLNFKSLGPDEEQFKSAKNDDIALSHVISTLFESILADQTKKRFEQFGSQHSEAELTALASRAQAHQNDPRYWKTAQGKKDKADLAQIQSEFGKMDSGGDSMTKQMSGLRVAFNKTGATPVNATIGGESFRTTTGSGWDKGSITIKLQKQ